MYINKFNNRIVFVIFELGLILGVFFYNYISKQGFTLIDELISFSLFSIFTFTSIVRKQDKITNKEFLVFGMISLFYLFYSIIIKVNVLNAIWMDFFIQVKPFIAFYCIYSLKIKFSTFQKKILIRTVIILVIMTMGIIMSGKVLIYEFFQHPAFLAMNITCMAILYYYCNKDDHKGKNVFLLILAVGLFSFRSKAYGFFVISFMIVYYVKAKLKWNWQNIIIVFLFIVIALFVSWSKIEFYYIDTLSYGIDDVGAARPILFIRALDILNDYFPFGSGLGTYATHSSAVYYSPLYYKYNMWFIHGLTPYNTDFVSDTFYPQLAQFGYVGIILYVVFWIFVYKKLCINFKLTKNLKNYQVGLLILLFFVIESVAASTFLQAQGCYMMMVLGMVLSDKTRLE